MASRSNKTSRSKQAMAAAGVKPRSFGTPTGAPVPSQSTAGRNRVREATPEERRRAIDADRAATRSGAQEMARQRKKRTAQQQPAVGASEATKDLSVLNAAETIKNKKSRDMDYIDKAGK